MWKLNETRVLWAYMKWQEGYTMENIAMALGVEQPAISYAFKRFGLKTKINRGKGDIEYPGDKEALKEIKKHESK